MERIEFTKEMKQTHTILMPNMLDVHFRLLQKMFRTYGYKMELLQNEDKNLIEEGLKYVHNDTCYPALLTIGQMVSALKSGKYDLDKTALIMSQTGGGCRASNYIHLLRKALVNADLKDIPVISLNLSGLEKNSGFKFTLPMLRRALAALIYGDLLMLLENQVIPYEKNKGEAKALTVKWTDKICNLFEKNEGIGATSSKVFLKQIVDEYSKIEITDEKKIKVGIVGEIYVKYSALANNYLQEFLESEGCEVMVPGILAFILFKTDNRIEDIKLYGGSGAKKIAIDTIFKYFLRFEDALIEALEGSRFVPPARYEHLKKLVEPMIGYGCKMGEGWLLTAEMLELIETGYENVVCAQPFGCLPNHIVGKGMIRKICKSMPKANIVPIDYDPGATKVNQENRIKLMLAVAKENI